MLTSSETYCCFTSTTKASLSLITSCMVVIWPDHDLEETREFSFLLSISWPTGVMRKEQFEVRYIGTYSWNSESQRYVVMKTEKLISFFEQSSNSYLKEKKPVYLTSNENLNQTSPCMEIVTTSLTFSTPKYGVFKLLGRQAFPYDAKRSGCKTRWDSCYCSIKFKTFDSPHDCAKWGGG